MPKLQGDVVGFDTEWKPDSIGKKNKVSLLQIATADQVFLIRMHLLSAIPPSLRYLLESNTYYICHVSTGAHSFIYSSPLSSILKAGVAVTMDAKQLWQDYGISCAGLIDLQALAHRHNCADGGTSLRSVRHLTGL